MKVLASAVALVAALFTAAVSAQGYPNHPIKVIVPWPPGQATDSAARIVSEALGPLLGQQLVIDNRPGAGGTIGSEHAAKSAPDGYTILAGSSGPISISPNLQKLPYEPAKDFEPIALLVSTPYILVVNPSVPASTVQEFIALLRDNPGKYNYASSGTGATSHLVTEVFNASAKVKAIHVPYKGSGPAMTDLIAGHVSYAFETSAAVLGHVKAGRLKALAMPETKAKLIAAGLEPGDLTPEEFAEFLKKQNDHFAAIIRQANIKID